MKNLVFFFCFLSSWIILQAIPAPQHDFEEKELKVSLRLIGHELLLRSGDSTSRVLPIVADSNTYEVRFDTEFALHPDVLIYVVDSVMSLKKHVNAYIVEVRDCDSEEVVHSYAVNGFDNQNLMACRGRALEKSCYSILFTLNKIIGNPFEKANGEIMVFNDQTGGQENKSSIEENKSGYLWLLFIFLIPGILFFFLKPRKGGRDNDLITLGNYNFDQQRGELLFNDDKTELSSKESDLLLLLFQSINNTLEREVILNKVWGDEGDYVGRTLDVFISKLRKKLSSDSRIKIMNVRGVGYKMIISNS